MVFIRWVSCCNNLPEISNWALCNAPAFAVISRVVHSVLSASTSCLWLLVKWPWFCWAKFYFSGGWNGLDHSTCCFRQLLFPATRIWLKFNEHVKSTLSSSTTTHTKAKQTQGKAHSILQREHEPQQIASSIEMQECEASFLRIFYCGPKKLQWCYRLDFLDDQNFAVEAFRSTKKN